MRLTLSVLFRTLCILVFFSASAAFGFAEMVRYRYVNCTTCHVSPDGGGVLTAYGRGLSEEVLTTWKREGEGQFAYGLVKTPDWLHVGGDFRELQLYTDSPRSRDAMWIWMQNDLEAAVTAKGFTADATLGYNDQKGDLADHLISRRYFLMYQPMDKVNVRAGRFMRAYGINTPDHYLPIKQGLGMDEGMETDNVEASYIGDDYDFFATGVFGRLDRPSLDREKGLTLRGSKNFNDTYKVGASYAYASASQEHRHFFGPYGILGLTPHAFILAETDFQALSQPVSTSAQWGIATYLRLDYEFIPGLHTYLSHDYLQQKFGDGASANAYGGGVQWFPRPHFEFVGFYRHLVMARGNTEELALLLHFYP